MKTQKPPKKPKNAQKVAKVAKIWPFWPSMACFGPFHSKIPCVYGFAWGSSPIIALERAYLSIRNLPQRGENKKELPAVPGVPT